MPKWERESLAVPLAERLEIHYTPKHESWLNIAEIELSVLKRQCLAGRIDCIEKMRSEVVAWNADRNNRQTQVDWQFGTSEARVKLNTLIQNCNVYSLLYRYHQFWIVTMRKLTATAAQTVVPT